MDAPRILIADTNEDLRETLREMLGQRYQVRTCGNGRLALDLLHSFRPDILVLELILPELDGLYLIEQAVSLPNPPLVMLMTRQDNGYVRRKCTTLRIVKMLLKPCDLLAAEASIREIAEQLQGAPSDADLAEVAGILLGLGLQVHRDGFELLKFVIPLFLRNPNQPIFKVIYNRAGHFAGKSEDSRSVEKAIRTAIVAGWKRGDKQRWQELFHQEPGKAPSNKVFVARIAELIKNGK